MKFNLLLTLFVLETVLTKPTPEETPFPGPAVLPLALTPAPAPNDSRLLKTLEQQPRFESSCQKPVSQCQHIPNATCLDSALPYDHISLDLTGQDRFFWEVQQELNAWRPLKNVPKCWSLVQQLLCSVYMPKCQQNDEGQYSVALASRQICRATRGPCRIALELFPNGWPEFLRCNNTAVFSPLCDSRSRPPIYLKTTEGQCPYPLVATKKAAAFDSRIDGCGMQCREPLFSKDLYESFQSRLIGIVSLLVVLALICMVTHSLAGWESVNKYPGNIIFFMTICFFPLYLGFLLQFAVGADLVCESDGTRKVHLAAGDGLSVMN